MEGKILMDHATYRTKMAALQATADTTYADLKAGRVTQARFDEVFDGLEKEQQQLGTRYKSRLRANELGGGAGPDEYPGGWSNVRTKGISSEKWRPPSVLDTTQQQWESLFAAAKSKMPSFAVDVADPVSTKMLGAGGDIRFKATSSPTVEGVAGAGGSLLPPVLLPEAFTERYEPDRLFAHLPGMAADGQWVSFLKHVSNTNPATPSPELGTIPDVGMVIEPQQVTFTRVNAMCTFSIELLRDFSEFMGFVPAELAKEVIDAETDFVCNNTDTSYGQSKGLLHTDDVLTRNALLSDTPIDAVVASYNDIRTGSSFGTADLVAMHPSTWLALRTVRSSTGLYVLDQNEPGNLGESFDRLFGVRIITNTKIPAGLAISMDASLAATAWTRQGLELMTNWSGDSEFSTYSWSFRCVERIAVGVQRPTAICVVSNLPTGGWSS